MVTRVKCHDKQQTHPSRVQRQLTTEENKYDNYFNIY